MVHHLTFSSSQRKQLAILHFTLSAEKRERIAGLRAQKTDDEMSTIIWRKGCCFLASCLGGDGFCMAFEPNLIESHAAHRQHACRSGSFLFKARNVINFFTLIMLDDGMVVHTQKKAKQEMTYSFQFVSLPQLVSRSNSAHPWLILY